MAIQIPNSFTSYELTEQEEVQGCIFATVQLQVLQNHLAAYAEEKLALEYNPEHKERFLQEEAGLSSKIALLQYLIDTSNVTSEALANPQQPQV